MDKIQKTNQDIEKRFKKFADAVDRLVGSPYWFSGSLIFVFVWFLSGFFFGFNEHWQLFINTSTTILTFLMLSLLHTTQQKWENKMERLQQKEAQSLDEIKIETKKVSEESLAQRTSTETEKQP